MASDLGGHETGSCRLAGQREMVTATKIDKTEKHGYDFCMSRPLRYARGGMVFHVLNRGVGRRTLFDKDEDFLAFSIRWFATWSETRWGQIL